MNNLIRPLTVAASFFLVSSTQALSDQPATEQSSTSGILPTKPGMHLVLNAGLTAGGDLIYTGPTINTAYGNFQEEIHGGSLVQFGIGELWQFEENPVALLLSANYHVDRIVAQNGDATYSRFPIEMLAYYTGKARYRFGGGLRAVKSPEASSTVNGVSDKINFGATTGFVIEMGYQLTQHIWINFRAVSERYQAKNRTTGGTTTSLAGTASIDGSHVGVNFSYEF